MKKLIALAFYLTSLTTLNAQTQMENCIYKDIPQTNVRYVHPVYKVDVNYFFDKSTKNAYALVTWQFDLERTRTCFNLELEKFPNNKLLIPTVTVSEVRLKVLGQNNFVNLDVFPMASGHWTASTQMVPIPFSSKEMVAQAIENKLPIVEFDGNPRMRISITEKKPVKNIKCTEKEEEAGALNLFNNLKKVKEKADSLISLGVKSEEALEEFFSKCVQFNSVNAESFQEFDREQKIYSKIKKGEFSLMGYGKKETYEKMKGFLVENASIQTF